MSALNNLLVYIEEHGGTLLHHKHYFVLIQEAIKEEVEWYEIEAKLKQSQKENCKFRKEREWQPVKEEISPEEGKFVIVDFGNNEIGVGVWFYEDCEHDEHEIGCQQYAQWMCCNYGDNQMSSCDAPTHWMPLPEPPEVK